MEYQPTAPESRGADRSLRQRFPLPLECAYRVFARKQLVNTERTSTVDISYSADRYSTQAEFGGLAAETARQDVLSKLAPSVSIRDKGIVQLFVYLQLLDFLTTLVGFKLGAAEGSPFIRLLMHAGPVTGVAASKLIALALGGFCLYLNKHHLLRWATYWYGGLVVWNLMMLLASPIHAG